jgi:hypothetical protein
MHLVMLCSDSSALLKRKYIYSIDNRCALRCVLYLTG